MDLNEFVRMTSKELAGAVANYTRSRMAYDQQPNSATETRLMNSQNRLKAMQEKARILMEDIKSKRSLAGVERTAEAQENVAKMEQETATGQQALDRWKAENPETVVIYQRIYADQIEAGATHEEASAYVLGLITNKVDPYQQARALEITDQIEDENTRELARLGIIGADEAERIVADQQRRAAMGDTGLEDDAPPETQAEVLDAPNTDQADAVDQEVTDISNGENSIKSTAQKLKDAGATRQEAEAAFAYHKYDPAEVKVELDAIYGVEEGNDDGTDSESESQ